MLRIARLLLATSIACLGCRGEGPGDIATTDGAGKTGAASTTAAVSPSRPDVNYDSADIDSLGRAAYASCATCHQADGSGVRGLLSPLAGSEIVLGRPEVPVAIILHGMKGPVTVKGTIYRGLMISWGGSLDDVQVAALTTHIRTAWGNAASAVTPELVARVRAATASRTTMWTWDELQKASF